MVVAASKDTSFELFLASGEDYSANQLEVVDVETDPKKLQLEKTKTQYLELL
jgi:hypothetical protein